MKLNDYIVSQPSDELSKIQSYLDDLLKKQNEKIYKCININLNTWDVYLKDKSNSPFLEYLKSFLVEFSFSYNEITGIFEYISKYNNRDFNDILLIITNHYDKINDICKTSKSTLILSNYITPQLNDDLNTIQTHLDIIHKKNVENNYRSITIDLKIYDIYLSNGNNVNFLEYLKSYLIEDSFTINDLDNALKYISKYNNKDINGIFSIIKNHYNKINNLCSKEKYFLTLNKYVSPQSNDDLSKIQSYLDFLLQKKLEKNYKSIYINLNTWDIYISSNNNPTFFEYLKSYLIKDSMSYIQLCESFEYISKYNNKDINDIFSIIKNHYNEIHDICSKKKSFLQLNDYISPKSSDDLSKIQSYLDFIHNKNEEHFYRSISISLITWDIYLSNINFFEYLKSYLIYDSYSYDEVLLSLKYLSKHSNKDFVEMLKIIVNNYDKLRQICKKDGKNIDIKDLIDTKVGDNQENIKEYFTYIFNQKRIDKYEFIVFDINIWYFYVINNCNIELLTYIENKFFESSNISTDILYSLDYSSMIRKKSFSLMLDIILQHVQKIISIFQKENLFIYIQSYIEIKPNTDDLSKIYEFIKKIVEQERIKSYCFLKFTMNLITSYSNTELLDNLKCIRKIIYECKTFEPELSEDTLNLPQRIHDVGFLEIQRGTLVGDKLLKFLAEDETVFFNKQLNICHQTNIYLQEQLNKQANRIEELESINKSLTNRINTLENQTQELYEKDGYLRGKIHHIEGEGNRLEHKIDRIGNDLGHLESKVEKQRSNIDDIGMKVGGIKREVNDVDRKVDSLEKKVNEHISSHP